MSDKSKQSTNQGEGDGKSARVYNEATKRFVKSGKVRKAARDAAPRNSREQSEMKEAERIGKSHAREEDPNVHRDYDKDKPSNP